MLSPQMVFASADHLIKASEFGVLVLAIVVQSLSGTMLGSLASPLPQAAFALAVRGIIHFEYGIYAPAN